MPAYDMPPQEEPQPRDSPLLDFEHPGFKRAIFVLCDQLWVRGIGQAIGTIALPAWIRLVRYPVELIFPPRYRIAEIMVYSWSIYIQWKTRDDEMLNRSYQTPFDHTNQARINHSLRVGLNFTIPALMWVAVARIMHLYPGILWVPLSLLWTVVTTWSFQFFFAFMVVFSLYPQGRRFMVVSYWRFQPTFEPAWKSFGNAVFSVVMIHRPFVRLLDRFFGYGVSLLELRHKQAAGRFLCEGATQPATYKYVNLSTELRQIRLLKISTTVLGATCELAAFNHDATIPKYEAISWRWGPDQKTHSLQLGTSIIHVNKQVFNILSELTPNLGTRYIWLDYLCIDQNNDAEKASQIPMMTAIYRGATRAIAYVGDGEGSHLVPDFLAELESHVLQRVAVDVFPKMDRTDHFPFRDRPAEWRALLTLLSCDIWSRAWIIQEIAISKKVVLLYGGQYISWDMFARLMKCFKTLGPDAITLLVLHETYGIDRRSCRFGMDFVGRLHHFRELIEEHEMVSLPHILVECIQAEATKPRDKLYALQNLDERYKTALTPDYDPNISDRDVYWDITAYSMEKLHDFALLGLAGLANRSPQTDLPSWIPDFSRLPRIYPLDNAHCKYTAGGRREAQVRSSRFYSTVEAKGVVLDHLHILDEQCPWKVGLEMSPAAAEEFLQSLKMEETQKRIVQWPHSFLSPVQAHFRALGQQKYCTGQSLEEALWRTSIGDNDELAVPAHSRIMLAFEAHKAAHMYHTYGETPQLDRDFSHLRSLSDVELLMHFQKLSELLSRRAQGRKLAVTRKGYLVLVPDRAEEGDAVVVMKGARVPYVLRGMEREGQREEKTERGFELVGEAYVHGYMDGLVFEYTMERDCEWITLIG